MEKESDSTNSNLTEIPLNENATPQKAGLTSFMDNFNISSSSQRRSKHKKTLEEKIIKPFSYYNCKKPIDKTIKVEVGIAEALEKYDNKSKTSDLNNKISLEALKFDPKVYKARSKVDLKELKKLITDENTKTMSLKEISSIFGVSKNTIQRILKEDFKLKKSKIKFDKYAHLKKQSYEKACIYAVKFQSILLNNDIILYFDETMFQINDICPTCWTKDGKSISVPVKETNKYITLNLAVNSEGDIFFSFAENKNDTSSFNNFLDENKKGLLDYAHKINTKFKKTPYIYLDNYGPHNDSNIKLKIKEMGLEIIYGPPYRPMANAAEYIFGILKNKIRRKLLKTL